MALKNNRRILRRAEAPLVCSLFSLPPSPFIRHWRRSTPSPTFWLLLPPKVTPAQRGKKIYARAKAKILRLVLLAQNDKTITYVVFQRADVGIRPYTIFGRFRDVEDAVPYAVIQNISVRQIQIYLTVLYQINAENSTVCLTCLNLPNKKQTQHKAVSVSFNIQSLD